MANAPGLFADGAAYERLMGRWSRLVGDQFLDWLNVPNGLRWLDVGCGNGAFTEAVIARCAPSAVEGIDPSQGQISYAQTRGGVASAHFQVGDAQSIPFPDNSFDIAAMALVIAFVPEPPKAASEMVRVVRPGCWAATYMWDIPGGCSPVDPVYTALNSLGFEVARPAQSWVAQRDALQALWEGAGLTDVEIREIRIPVVYPDFEDFWGSNSLPSGPQVIHSMTPDAKEQLRARLREQIPIGSDGRVTFEAKANAVKGRKPA